jgi:hypothetical protein
LIAFTGRYTRPSQCAKEILMKAFGSGPAFVRGPADAMGLPEVFG